MEILMAYSSFECLLKIGNYRPTFVFYCLEICSASLMHITGCFAQIHRHRESSGRTCQTEDSSCYDSSADLLMAFLEQVLGDHPNEGHSDDHRGLGHHSTISSL